MKSQIKQIMNKVNERFIDFVYLSLAMNLVTGFSKMLISFYIPSLWFGLNAGYYIVLCLARIMIIRGYRLSGSVQGESERYEIEKNTYYSVGLVIVALSVSYFCISLRMFFHGDTTTYGNYLVYLVALIAFSKLGLAVYGTIITRKMQKPVVSALKLINFADALVSIVVTQCAILGMVHPETDFAQWNGTVGMVVSAVILYVGFHMAISMRRRHR